LSTVFIIKSSPTKGLRAYEGLRLIAAMLGMGNIPFIVFVEEGVRCLLRGAFKQTGREYLKTASDLAGISVLSESFEDIGIKIDDIDPELKAKIIGIDRLTSMVIESKATIAF